MTGKEWVEAFINSLHERKNLKLANAAKYNNSDSLWTELIVKRVMKDTMAEKLKCSVTCRDQNDKKNSGEYLNIDAIFFNKLDYKDKIYSGIKEKEKYDPWVLPAAVVEHENEGYNKNREEKIAFCLWKLLCIRSNLRVLICYHKNIDSIKLFLQKIVRAKLAKELMGELFVIIGDTSKDKDSNEWKTKEDIRNYFSIFEWKNNNRLEKFTE